LALATPKASFGGGQTTNGVAESPPGQMEVAEPPTSQMGVVLANPMWPKGVVEPPLKFFILFFLKKILIIKLKKYGSHVSDGVMLMLHLGTFVALLH
jgi:hypothetical protein